MEAGETFNKFGFENNVYEIGKTNTDDLFAQRMKGPDGKLKPEIAAFLKLHPEFRRSV